MVDATGAGPAIADGLTRVAPGGTFLQFGVASYSTRVEIEPYRIYNKEITITGSMAVLHSYERAAELFAGGVLDPEIFISHRLPLEQYPQALEMVKPGQGRKIQVRPGRAVTARSMTALDAATTAAETTAGRRHRRRGPDRSDRQRPSASSPRGPGARRPTPPWPWPGSASPPSSWAG